MARGKFVDTEICEPICESSVVCG